MPLTWSLTLATFERAGILCECVEYALRQTRPPQEIVICDASADWVSSRNRVAELIGRLNPQTSLWYGPSPASQQTIQRNIALEHSTADVLFMIDDDSFLRRNAAELVMAEYESHHQLGAVGIGAMKTWRGVDVTDDDAPMIERHRGVRARIRNSLFFAFPVRSIYRLAGRRNPALHETRSLEGFQITVRREIARRCRFDENLVTGHFEDADATMRFAHEGALAMLRQPLLYHAVAPRSAAERRRGVLARFGWILNIAYLNRKHFGSGIYVRGFCWTHWIRCVIADFVLGMVRWDFARLRACVDVMPAMVELTFADQQNIGRVVAVRSKMYKSRLIQKIAPIAETRRAKAA